MSFSHEKLRVYQHAIEFVGWVDEQLEKLPSGVAVRGQLDRASTSIALNIAEGNGKFSARDRSRFFQIANGSALECAACLDVLVVKRLMAVDEVTAPKALLESLVNQLHGLIRRCDQDVVREEAGDYGTAEGKDRVGEQKDEDDD